MKTIASIKTGIRQIMGINHAVESYVVDEGKDYKGRKTWRLHKSVCNGICEGGSQEYKTRKSALEALESYTGEEVAKA